MFKILQKTFSAGIVTTEYPRAEAKLSSHARGAPQFDFETWLDARPAAAACPSGAIAVSDKGVWRRVTVDYGKCIFCGECAAADASVRVTQ
jgi:formate hydrogenlyase subunit 6/NADH:ubiquinone oxidoreductase subunit I